jgi:membrane protease YdiL (CAAX protease family)
MRVRPTATLGVTIALGYIALWIGLARVFGADYMHVDSPDAIRPFAMSLAICAVTIIVLVTVLGWWAPVAWERPRLGGPVWILPAILGAVAIVSIVLGHASTVPSSRLVWTAILAALVGFSEEMVFRGLAIVGLRGGVNERNVWLYSTVLFSLLHLPNIVLGQELPGVPAQLITTFFAGSILYLARRSFGTIVAAMVIHGLWDFSLFVGPHPAMGLVQLGTPVALFLGFIVWRHRILDTGSDTVPGTAAV